jgi:hypothetical protein
MNKSCSGDPDQAQDGMDNKEPKPAHVHFSGSEFLDGGGHDAFIKSSVVKLRDGEHPKHIPTLEEHLKRAYQFLEM